MKTMSKHLDWWPTVRIGLTAILCAISTPAPAETQAAQPTVATQKFLPVQLACGADPETAARAAGNLERDARRDRDL
jgi:hypothetical protein